jgi:hypothetical protein
MGLGIERSVTTDHATAADAARRDGADLVAALVPTQAASRTEAPSRPVWEYRSELLERGLMGWGSGRVDLRALQQRLDELGADGWELVHVSWDHRVRGKRGGHVLLFKRPGVADHTLG